MKDEVNESTICFIFGCIHSVGYDCGEGKEGEERMTKSIHQYMSICITHNIFMLIKMEMIISTQQMKLHYRVMWLKDYMLWGIFLGGSLGVLGGFVDLYLLNDVSRIWFDLRPPFQDQNIIRYSKNCNLVSSNPMVVLSQ